MQRIKGNSPVVQWLGLCTFTAKGPGSIPGWGTKIPQAMRCGQRKKKNQKFNFPFTHPVGMCSLKWKSKSRKRKKWDPQKQGKKQRQKKKRAKEIPKMKRNHWINAQVLPNHQSSWSRNMDTSGSDILQKNMEPLVCWCVCPQWKEFVSSVKELEEYFMI